MGCMGKGKRRPSHREEFCKKPKGTFGMAVGEELIIVVALCVCPSIYLCSHWTHTEPWAWQEAVLRKTWGPALGPAQGTDTGPTSPCIGVSLQL